MKDWIMKIRISRILSTFWRLKSLLTTKELRYTLNEINKNDWIKMTVNQIYQLKCKNASYEIEVRVFCDPKHGFKIATVSYLINKIWEKNKQIVFCTIKLINALILYWMNDVQKIVEWYHEKIKLIEINSYDWFVKSKWR